MATTRPEGIDLEDALLQDLEWNPLGLAMISALWTTALAQGLGQSNPKSQVDHRYQLRLAKKEASQVSISQRRRQGHTIRAGHPDSP